MPRIDIRHDMERLSWQLGLLANEQMPAAIRAMNRSLTTVRAEAARTLSEHYAGLRVFAIRRRIRFFRASRQKPNAVLRFGTQRFRLINWNVRQTRTGVVGRIPPGLMRLDAFDGKSSPVSPAQLRHAFIRTSRSKFNPRGLANVWLRQGKDRTPIDVVVSPSLSETLAAQHINAALARRAQERFAVVFLQEAKFRLSKRGG